MFRQLFRQRANLAGLTVSDALEDQLERYFLLLAAWNLKMNLSGFDLKRPSTEAIDRLFVEPLIAATHLRGRGDTLLDIGSGGGSPAIPMALALSPGRAVLVEAKARKGTFLREVVSALGLSDVIHVAVERFESYCERAAGHQAFSIITVRAVRLATPQLELVAGVLSDSGAICWFRNEGEINGWLPQRLRVEHLLKLGSLPGSQLAVLTKQSE